MKIIILGDPHFRTTNPIGRKDDFMESQLEKIEEVLSVAREFHQDHAVVLAIAGDLFDTPHCPDYLKHRLFLLLKKYGVFVLTVYGQHDLYFRSIASRDKVALKVFESAGFLRILDENPFVYAYAECVAFYGASMDEKIPEPQYEIDLKTVDGVLGVYPGAVAATGRGYFNVLLVHKMLSDSKVPWEYTDARRFLEEHSKYDLIISGDNHQPFIIRTRDHKRMLVNIGTMSRKKTNEADIDPSYAIYDTVAKQLDVRSIKCAKPSEEVFKKDVSEDAIKSKIVVGPLVEALAYSLKVAKREKIDYKKLLKLYFENNKDTIRPGTRELFARIISAVDEKGLSVE